MLTKTTSKNIIGQLQNRLAEACSEKEQIEMILSEAEDGEWSFIQDNDDQELSIGRVHEFLISRNLAKDSKQQQAGEILNRLRDLDLINIEHAR